ncbi:acyltransferase [Streptomyces sp. NPDC057428]|uniref:acyltransferase family protein n=1 Tax=Streptomyces sp. NPDC057428 TaxID=3346129 RepID=UPI0036A6412C
MRDALRESIRRRWRTALRALAVLGVVCGHWLVTALVADSGTVHGSSPLRYMPRLAPVSWLFQTLALFFLVGGLVGARAYASARARGESYGRWLRVRTGRLFRPVTVVLAVWTLAAGVMLATGVDERTVRALGKLVWSPLWFLLVFAALTAATPWLARLHPLWPLAVVLHADLLRLGLDGPAALGWVNVAAGWMVPYCLGTAWARGGLRDRGTGWMLLIGGSAATAGLVLFAGYPASMVGVPGAALSNLDPPTLAAVTFGLAQCGAALLLLGRLRRVLARPAIWAPVALLNLSAMTVFLWHQTAMIVVTSTVLFLCGPLPGLHTVPDGPAWVFARPAWLPLFALVLLVCWFAFGAYEQRRGARSKVVRSASPARTRESHHA